MFLELKFHDSGTAYLENYPPPVCPTQMPEVENVVEYDIIAQRKFPSKCTEIENIKTPTILATFTFYGMFFNFKQKAFSLNLHSKKAKYFFSYICSTPPPPPHPPLCLVHHTFVATHHHQLLARLRTRWGQ